MKRATLLAAGTAVSLTAIVGAASLGASPAAQAQPASDPARQCFYTHNIDGYNAVDNRTLLVRVSGRNIYRVKLMNACPGLTFRHTMVLKTASGGGSVCGAIDLTLGFTDHGISESCPVHDIHKLSPDEVAAIPKHDLP
jgi:hypothetical protein